MATEVYAYFSIYGDDFNLDEVSSKMFPIIPTSVESKKPLLAFTKEGKTESSWNIYTKRKVSYDVDEALIELIEILKVKEQTLIEIQLQEKVSLLFQVVIILDNKDSFPAVILEPDTLYFLSNIGASFSIDVLH